MTAAAVSRFPSAPISQPSGEGQTLMSRCDGRAVVVTGGGSGIGAGIGEALAEACATVVLADVQEERVREVADRLAGNGFRVHSATVDITAAD
jgi:NADP-dependent 3-hydroxy acid dehydrogenase YdfG